MRFECYLKRADRVAKSNVSEAKSFNTRPIMKVMLSEKSSSTNTIHDCCYLCNIFLYAFATLGNSELEDV